MDRTPPEQPEKEPQAWDSRPYKKIVRGQEVEFFTIGAIGTALGRSTVTIRQWIAKGYLPAATYRLPDKNNIKGRRLYTRGQVEALLDVAVKHHIDGDSRVSWSKHKTFAAEIRQAWEQLPPI